MTELLNPDIIPESSEKPLSSVIVNTEEEIEKLLNESSNPPNDPKSKTDTNGEDFDIDSLLFDQQFNQQNAFDPDSLSGIQVDTELSKPSDSSSLSTKREFDQDLIKEIISPPSKRPCLLLPEHLIDLPQQDTCVQATLTPESEPSPSLDSRNNKTLFSNDVTINANIAELKRQMIASHTLLTTYTALKAAYSEISKLQQQTADKLKDSERWRHILADENVRLRNDLNKADRDAVIARRI